MSTPAIYACPACNSIVSGKDSDSDDMKCEKCEHVFNPHSQDKAELPDAPPEPKVSSKSGATVSRDVMRNRPSTGGFTPKAAPPVMVAAIEEPSEPTEDSSSEDPGMRRRRTKKRKENNKAFYFFLAGWLLVFTCIILVVKNMDKSNPEEGEKINKADQEERHRIARDRQFMNRHAQPAMFAVARYMKSLSSEERQPHIDHSIKLSSAFSRYYRFNNTEAWDGSPQVLARHVLETPAGLSLEFLITDNTKSIMEAHVMWDGRSWKLDWEQMTRHSEVDWTLFKTKRSNAEAYFRCYARPVESSNNQLIIIKLYQPWPHGEELDAEILKSYALPNIELHVDNPVAKDFMKRWQDYQDDKEYNSILDHHDPDGYMRLNAKLAWDLDDPEDPILQLKDIKASHWYGMRVLDAEKEELTKNNPVDSKP